MQELLALSELMAQIVRALTLGVCRADVRPLLGVLLVNLTILLSVRSIIMSQAMNPQCQVEWCSCLLAIVTALLHKFDSQSELLVFGPFLLKIAFYSHPRLCIRLNYVTALKIRRKRDSG